MSDKKQSISLPLDKVTLLHMAMSLPESCTAHEVFKYFYLIGAADGITSAIGGPDVDFEKQFNSFVEASANIDWSITPTP